MSASEQRLFGHWDTLKGKIKEHWGQITDDELMEVEGQYDQLVGLIQQKTGEARQQIKLFIYELAKYYIVAFPQSKDASREYPEHPNEALHETTEQLRERAREGFEQAHEVVRRRPAESVAVAFGTGILIGVIVGLISRSK
jgi:uncharacterized protein YjbJ (UPF0337 family)